ncbi:MAG: BrnA antitoxin family protein [Rubellimicrobium sp.]|nr:BrnA antitoxin family protein [Rubellimicrobium sp.]
MKENISGPFTLEQIRRMKGETDWERLRREGDYEGPEEFEVDWSRAELVIPEPKQAISLRVDADVLDFFRAQGKGYQTRMNAVLRAYMEAQKVAG